LHLRIELYLKNLKMSVLKLPLLYQGSKGEKSLYSLFDSGANLSCINEEDLDGLESPVCLHKPRMMATASENQFVEVTHRVTLEFYIHDVHLSDEFLVIPGLSEEAIIGAATMQKWRIKLDFDKDKVEVDPKVARLQLI
jgi:predicted aspartyl protease